MNATLPLPLSITLLALSLLVGCEAKSPPPLSAEQVTVEGNANSEIDTAIAELSPEDQVAARAQRFCAYADDSLLGSMGAPFKLMINDQAVFLCCEGCKSQALKDPEATLAKVADMKAKVQAEKK
jgi:hypothetical protein